MVRLDRSFTPTILHPKMVAALTARFKESKERVWHIDEVKSALLQTSFNKCAYCECILTTESKYMEVEHFKHKDTFPELVISWENLLPACKRCNGAKGTHNVDEAPIVNPYQTDPTAHFKLKHYRLYAKSDIGKESIGVLDLNNFDRVIKVRLEVGEALQSAIEIGLDKLDLFLESPTTRRKNSLITIVAQTLRECLPTAQYAATSATILHDSEDYNLLKAGLQQANLWNDELEDYDIASRKIALDSK